MWKLGVPLHLALLFSSGVVPLYHVEAGFGGEQTVEKSTVLFTYLLSPDFALGSRGLQQQLFGAFASSAWRQARFASGKSTAIKIAPSVVDFLYFLQQHSILLFNLSAIVLLYLDGLGLVSLVVGSILIHELSSEDKDIGVVNSLGQV